MFLKSGEGLKLAAFAFRTLPARLQPAVRDEVRDPAALTTVEDDPDRKAFFAYLESAPPTDENSAALGARINDFVGIAIFEGEVMYEASALRHRWSDEDYAFFAAQVISLLAGNNY